MEAAKPRHVRAKERAICVMSWLLGHPTLQSHSPTLSQPPPPTTHTHSVSGCFTLGCAMSHYLSSACISFLHFLHSLYIPLFLLLPFPSLSVIFVIIVVPLCLLADFSVSVTVGVHLCLQQPEKPGWKQIMTCNYAQETFFRNSVSGLQSRSEGQNVTFYNKKYSKPVDVQITKSSACCNKYAIHSNTHVYTVIEVTFNTTVNLMTDHRRTLSSSASRHGSNYYSLYF